MKIIPYLFIALAIAILAGSVSMHFGTYFELIHPTVGFRDGQKTAPVNSYWIGGFILNLVGSFMLLVAVLFLCDRSKTAQESHATNTRLESSKPAILVARPADDLAAVSQPLLELMALYQIPFVILFAVYPGQMNQNWFAIFGSATVLLLASFCIYWRQIHRMAVGELRLELDDAPELNPDSLVGRIVLNRQSDMRSTPLMLQLKLYENRERNSTGFDNSWEPINPRELYWQIRYKSESAIENPFQSETQFPFELSIPAWLPRPWTRPGPNATVGMEWQIEVSGRFAGMKVSKLIPIVEIPLRLQQAPEKRIKIPHEVLANLLAEQSILWQPATKHRTATTVRRRHTFLNLFAISTVCLTISIGCFIALFRQFDEFVLIVLVGSIAMLFAELCRRYVYRVTKIDESNVVREWRFFGLSFRRVIERNDLAAVSVEPRKIQRDDEVPHVEFDIFLQARSGKNDQHHLARIRTRLLAKAFAKAIANDLNLEVIYQVSNQ